jgi:hypothetical protein
MLLFVGVVEGFEVAVVVLGSSLLAAPWFRDSSVLSSILLIRCPLRQECVEFCIVHLDPERKEVGLD